jgi:O-6-methylguanine DNA methyltransferase
MQATPFGPLGIIWTIMQGQTKILRVFLSRPTVPPVAERIAQIYPSVPTASCADIAAISYAINEMFAGNTIEFSMDYIDLTRCNPFQYSVLLATRRIPCGRVSTYQHIANHLGIQNGARAIGRALASNLFPLFIPCHRVIHSDQRIGEYQGGSIMKRDLLVKEEVFFASAERVSCNSMVWATS